MDFKTIIFDEITEKNFFIKKKDYMCSIYCYGDNISFKQLNFKNNLT